MFKIDFSMDGSTKPPTTAETLRHIADQLFPGEVMVANVLNNAALELETRYTEAELKAAFWNVFHKAGELFFPSDSEEEDLNTEFTTDWFNDLLENLHKEKNMLEKDAEKKIRESRDSLNQTIKALSLVVVDQVDGTTDFHSVYLSKLRDNLAKLLEIRANLYQ